MNPAATPPTRGSAHRRRLSGLAGAVGAAVAAGLLLASPAAAAVSSTTVSPAGHSYTSSLVAGGTASFTVGSVSVNCNQSSTSGAVPAAPDNQNPAGPVSGPITPPTFSDSSGSCPTSVPATTATTVTSGAWAIGLQFDPAGSTGTLTIPQGGAVTTISGLASCTVTIAPGGPATVTGAWVPGSPAQLDFSAGPTVPISVTGGFGCPTAATSAVFKATYQVVDTTDPTQDITITS
jgi:hypothetical protein